MRWKRSEGKVGDREDQREERREREREKREEVTWWTSLGTMTMAKYPTITEKAMAETMGKTKSIVSPEEMALSSERITNAMTSSAIAAATVCVCMCVRGGKRGKREKRERYANSFSHRQAGPEGY